MWVSQDKSVMLVHTDAADLLDRKIDSGTAKLVIADPPWNTGGLRTGSSGATYSDSFAGSEYWDLLESLLRGVHRVLSEDGTFALWLDWRSVHLAAVLGDAVFIDGRVGEIICHSELGNPGKSAWPVKHSTILLFAKNPRKQKFNHLGLPRVRRKAQKNGHGKAYESDERRANSVLETTMSNTDGERVGYPDQKPAWVYRALVDCYTDKGDLVVDPFAGSGTIGRAVKDSGRFALMCDTSAEACKVAAANLGLARLQ